MNDTQQELQKLQAIEQSMHSIAAQHSAYQAQLLELENASKELAGAKEAYRIISNVMVKQDPAVLKAELDDKKLSVATRLASVEKQEQRLRQEMQQMQEKLLKEGA